jgi:hypothetical protein
MRKHQRLLTVPIDRYFTSFKDRFTLGPLPIIMHHPLAQYYRHFLAIKSERLQYRLNLKRIIPPYLRVRINFRNLKIARQRWIACSDEEERHTSLAWLFGDRQQFVESMFFGGVLAVGPYYCGWSMFGEHRLRYGEEQIRSLSGCGQRRQRLYLGPLFWHFSQSPLHILTHWSRFYFGYLTMEVK